ncbi:MAG: rhodanese-like domain-containing protein [Alphaproteobacteria bacterium]
MPKGVKDMLAEANAAVTSITGSQAKALIGSPDVVFLDVRDGPELAKTGTIPGAIHVSRGMLEFAADLESPYHKPALDRAKRVIVNCGSGGRSVLACKTLLEMGYPNVVNLAGGMNGWLQAGLPTEPVKE